MEEERSKIQSLVKLRCTNCNVENKFLFDNTIKYCASCKIPLFDLKNIGGFVYVLSNQSIPHLYKIGFTENLVEQRVSELNSSTSIPEKFEIELVFACKNPRKIESKVHVELNEFRHNDKREFFGASFESIYLALKSATNDDPILSKLTNLNNIENRKTYNPWYKRPWYKRPKGVGKTLTLFICPNCKNTTRKHHQNMDKRASFYCKSCKANYNEMGVKI